MLAESYTGNRNGKSQWNISGAQKVCVFWLLCRRGNQSSSPHPHPAAVVNLLIKIPKLKVHGTNKSHSRPFKIMNAEMLLLNTNT